MVQEWRLLNLSETPWMTSQSIYHALALIQEELEIPNTLIITWPNQPFVCIGLHQVIENSVEIEYLKESNLPYIRRACGGGSVYLDQNQVFYQIICRKEDYPQQLEDFYQLFLEPVVQTYRDFNIEAKYSPINDIIAEGRKISGNGAVTYGESRVLVGNFIFDFPASEMSRILKVPEEKFRDKIAKSLEERMGSFRFFLDKIPSKDEVISRFIENFQKSLNINMNSGELTTEEAQKVREIERSYQEKSWIYYVEKEGDELFQQKIKSGTYFSYNEKKFPGGLMQLFIHFEDDCIEEIVITGDFTISPPFVLTQLQEELSKQPVSKNKLNNRIEELFTNLRIDLPGIETEDITDLILDTYEKIRK